jgi:hypothetical protein
VQFSNISRRLSFFFHIDCELFIGIGKEEVERMDFIIIITKGGGGGDLSMLSS